MSKQGLSYKKFDLHIHTPESSDYQDKDIAAEDIVNKALSENLAGIAITDHQTGNFIDSVRKAARGKNLTVFPGVELKVTGGKEGIHLIILFDVNKDTAHVNAFLNTIKVYEHGGDHDYISDKSVPLVAKELQEFDPTAIMSFAHCDSSFGVNAEMKGKQRSNVCKPEWTCILGAEDSEENFLNEEKIEKGTRIIDLFDGGYEDFHHKKLGVYQASDAHCVKDIGSKYTFFKVDDDITIEDLRQCLIDRSVRIRQSFEQIEHRHPIIRYIKVTGGFLDGLKVPFHHGLNSVIGGKGSGKSLMIEFLRFALNQSTTRPSLIKDHESKLDNRLKLYGVIEVGITDESGTNYTIKRTYDPSQSNPTEVLDETGSSIEIQVEQFFPVLFLSQNEIIKIAEESTIAQREFIDSFFDFRIYQSKIETIYKQLEDVDRHVASSLTAHLAQKRTLKKINEQKEELKKIERQIDSEVFKEYAKQEKLGKNIDIGICTYNDLKDELERAEESLSKIKIEFDTEVQENPTIKRIKGSYEKLMYDVKGKLTEAKSLIENEINIATTERKDWDVKFTPIREKYQKAVQEAGGNLTVLEGKRKAINKYLVELQKSLTNKKTEAGYLTDRLEKRKTLLEELDEIYKKYYEERKDRCKFFTKSSAGKLNVTIAEKEDKTAYEENLKRLKRGSYLSGEMVEIFVGATDAKMLIKALLTYEWKERNDPTALDEITNIPGVKPEKIKKLVDTILDNNSYEDILALLYDSIPQDVPEIKYKVGSKYYSLDALSVGQKSTALLIMLLSDSAKPVVIDQPEDSLDLISIWEDVCKKLRTSKDQRQFIFTTHNSSVAVASDSDKFVVLRSTSNSSSVEDIGSMNISKTKALVVQYLEGGETTYKLKRKKYDID